jgi:hypothetical protein
MQFGGGRYDFHQAGSQDRDAFQGESGPLTVRMLSGYCKITDNTKYRKPKGIDFRTGLNLMMTIFSLLHPMLLLHPKLIDERTSRNPGCPV